MEPKQERNTLHTRPGYGRPNWKNKGPQKPKGHDGLLKDFQDTGAIVRFVLISDSPTVVGKIVARDKFTVSVLVSGGVDMQGQHVFRNVPRVIYKHALESFEMLQAGTIGSQSDNQSS